MNTSFRAHPAAWPAVANDPIPDAHAIILRNVLAARQRHQAMRADYATLMRDPNAKALNSFLAAWPEVASKLVGGWVSLPPLRRDAATKANTDIHQYLKSDDTEAAVACLQKYAQALRDKDGDCSAFPGLIGLMRHQSSHAKTLAALNLAAGMALCGQDPKSFIAVFGDSDSSSDVPDHDGDDAKKQAPLAAKTPLSKDDNEKDENLECL